MFVTALLQGQEPARKIELLFKLGHFTSQPIRQAITLHLVKGYPESMAYNTADVKQPNFHKALKRLNEINSMVEEINSI